MATDNDYTLRSERLHSLMERTATLLNLSEAEKNILFYDTEHMPERAYFSNDNGPILNETKFSYVLGIFKSINILYSDITRAQRRLRLPSTEVPFNGKSPLDLMLSGTDGLRLTRRYFDCLAQS